MDKELSELINYKKHYGNDNIYYKEIIKKKLLGNSKIIKALNNSHLDPDNPDDYFGSNIFPYYFLGQVQTEAKHYLCFETCFKEIPNHTRIVKIGQVIFYILCNNKDIYDKNTGISRHDLIAALIEDEFNWSTEFGTQLVLVSDVPYFVDNNYILRTLTFEQNTLNGIVDPNTQSIINNDR